MTRNKHQTQLSFAVDGHPAPVEAGVHALVIAGWTGSDPLAMEAHIAELEKMGVARPKTTPVFYRCGSALLTQAAEIEVVGDSSSGEVEPVIIGTAEGLLLAVGSDHTDRMIETIGVSVSKQMCAKPLSGHAWLFSEVAGHWDALTIRSFATKDGERRLYQEGSLAKMRHPDDLMTRYGGRLAVGTVMYCGTTAVHGAIEGCEIFEIELEDPVLNRRISHRYAIHTLPVPG